jgi:hypothetical protein
MFALSALRAVALRGRMPRALSSSIFAALFAVLAATQAHAQSALDRANFDNLDVAIYWYGANGVNQRAVPGQSNPFFNPARPTVIYMHGWQPNTVQSLSRETFNRSELNSNGDVARPWIDRGWNVGIFYWNQFADEGEVKDAEAKIYTAAGPRQMRWRNAAGNYTAGPAQSVTTQFISVYRAAMSGYTGSQVRLVGHSLGAQLAINAASELLRQRNAGTLASNLLPLRVALLDAAFLNGARDYLGGKWPGEVARENVSANRGTLSYEYYRTSGATSNGFIGDTNQGLIDMVTMTEIKPWYFNAFEIDKKHRMAPGWYFESMGTSVKVKCTGRVALSASVDNATLRNYANAATKFEQLDGKYTRGVSDDTFDQKGDGC